MGTKEEDFLESLGLKRPLDEVAAVTRSQGLVETYKRGFSNRYGRAPIVSRLDEDVLHMLGKNAGFSPAVEIIEEFFRLDDENFLRYCHNVKSLSLGLNRVIASLGQKDKARLPQGARVMDEVDRFLYYLFESRAHQEANNVIRTEADTLAIGAPDGPKISRELITRALSPLRGRDYSFLDVKEAFAQLITEYADSYSEPEPTV